MKTKRLFITSILLSLIPLLTACGDDKGNEPEPPPKPVTPVTVDVTYTTHDMHDLIEMVGVNVEYTDKDGKTVKETVTTRTWTKSLTKVSVPFTAKIKISYTAKEDFTPVKDNYTIAKGIGISYQTSDGRTEISTGSLSIGLSKDKIEQHLIDKIIGKPQERTREILAK